MKIAVITCHDVYNAGASLQAYALQTYLNRLGHDAEIIDYKPDYLSGHYRLNSVSNPVYDKAVIKWLYILVKLPGRWRAKRSMRKKRFDSFLQDYLVVTRRRYTCNEDLKRNCPEADLFIAGSDQIWNPLFPNGKDPAFFLDFVPEGRHTISYAASFAVEELPVDIQEKIRERLRKIDAISVRESSALSILRSLGIRHAYWVLDPVFLLTKEKWSSFSDAFPVPLGERYIFICDFENDDNIRRLAQKKAKESSLRIFSFFPNPYADRVVLCGGPGEFVSLVRHASFVISNSFHATAFSILFEKEFAVFDRKEKINSRIHDLLKDLGCEEWIQGHEQNPSIDYDKVNAHLQKRISESKSFLQNAIEGVYKADD